MTSFDEINEKEFIKVSTLENPFETQILVGILEDEGIPFHIRSYHDTAYDGLFQMQKGWGIVRAPQEYKARILKVIEDIRSSSREDIDFSSSE